MSCRATTLDNKRQCSEIEIDGLLTHEIVMLNDAYAPDGIKFWVGKPVMLCYPLSATCNGSSGVINLMFYFTLLKFFSVQFTCGQVSALKTNRFSRHMYVLSQDPFKLK